MTGQGWVQRHAWRLSLPFLVVILGLRCFLGLDLSDEMQYYGQMAALAQKRALFTTDLFIQQLSYLPVYPLLRAHWLAFGDQGLVLFGRALLSLALLAQFLYVRRWFLQRGSSPWQASLVALALSFVATYHGIFAISYNTLSQMAWVVFCLWFMDPHRVPPWRWALLVVLTGFAHPAAALTMAILIGVRLWRLDRTVLVAWFALSAVLSVAALSWTLSFASLASIEQSLMFSKEFAVGNAIFGRPSEWAWALAYVAVLMLTGLRTFHHVPARHSRWILPALALCAIYGARYLAIRHLAYGYTAELTQMAVVFVALAGVWLAQSETGKGPSAWALRVAIAAQFLVLVVTSSNGLAQGVGGAMVAMPLLLGAASMRGPSLPEGKEPSTRGLTGVLSLVLLLYLVHWSNCPYRDQRWYHLAGGTTDVSAFKHIHVSDRTQQLVHQIRADVQGRLAPHASAWIASEWPALYFVLDVKPASCMLYMHSLGGASSRQLLSTCMRARDPEVILDVHPAATLTEGQREVRDLVQRLVDQGGMTCGQGQLRLAAQTTRPRMDALPLAYRLCVKP